jgi:hypothetical protein
MALQQPYPHAQSEIAIASVSPSSESGDDDNGENHNLQGYAMLKFGDAKYFVK